MSEAAKKLLHTLDNLPEADRQEIFREVLRRVERRAHDSPSDEDLISAADEMFLELERGESEE